MNKTILITGASKGIGLALTKLFLANGDNVIGTCREGKIDNFIHPNLKVLKLDLSNNESVTSFSNSLVNNCKIDILINNAGVGPDLDTFLPNIESFKQTFEVNVTGTVFLTESLIDKINQGGKIINISSEMGSIGKCERSDSVAYRMSKSALNMYTKILTTRLKGSQTVASVHPGWVRTTIAKSNITQGRLSPEESASKIVDFVLSYFESGTYWDIETQSKFEW